MKRIELAFYLTYGRPKKDEENKLIDDLISSFQAIGVSDAKVESSYYVSERAMPDAATLVLVVLTALSNIATLTMAVRDFLKDHEHVKAISLETGSLKLNIKKGMSNEDIIKLVTEARKILETERK